MKKFFKIKSITDVITNSSTEVFVTTNVTDELKNSINDFKYLHIKILDTEDKVKKFLKEIFETYDDSRWEIMYNLISKEFDYDYIPDSFALYCNIRFLIFDLDKSFDEIYNLYKTYFNKLIGTAYTSFEDNYWYDEYEISKLNELGFTYVDRI